MKPRAGSSSLSSSILLGLVVAFLALFLGLVAASGFLVGQMLVFGLLLGGLLLLLPLEALFVILMVVTFVVQGSATYFLRFHQAAWLPYLLCLLLFVKAVDLRPAQREVAPAPAPPTWSSAAVMCLGLYFLCLASATLINRPSAGQLIVGLKNALPLWIAVALVYQGARLPRFLDRLWTVFNVLFFVQLPLVVFQHFIVVPWRRDAESTGMDAVVGTFGGLIDGGGANSTLVLFSLLVMAHQLALWARGQILLRRLLVFWSAGLVIVLAGEVKAALIWIPLIILYVLRTRVVASFGSALATILISGLLVSGLFAAYSVLYWDRISGSSSGDLVGRMRYFFDAKNINYRTGEISRGASLALWAADPRADAARRILGYGPGASRISATSGLGEVAARYAPLELAATSASLLLWDSGLLGALAFAGILLATALSLRRIASNARLPPRELAAADAFGAGMLMFITLLLYNRSLNDEPSVQLLLAIAVGCALHWSAVGPARGVVLQGRTSVA